MKKGPELPFVVFGPPKASIICRGSEMLNRCKAGEDQWEAERERNREEDQGENGGMAKMGMWQEI